MFDEIITELEQFSWEIQEDKNFARKTVQRLKMIKKLFYLTSVLMVASMALIACQPAAEAPAAEAPAEEAPAAVPEEEKE